jgi:hypothetical protein
MAQIALDCAVSGCIAETGPRVANVRVWEERRFEDGPDGSRVRGIGLCIAEVGHRVANDRVSRNGALRWHPPRQRTTGGCGHRER